MKNRVRVRREYKPVDEDNMVFNHSLQDVTEYTFCCSLEGCNKMYSVSLYPKQSVYPRYCEEHRNPFKRKNFLREKKKWTV